MNASVLYENVTVLVVDDHSYTRDMVRSILKAIGFTNVLGAENGYAAMQVLEEERIGLIICDWNMPDMSGIEVLRVVKDDDRWKHIPFIMLTAEVYKENVGEALKVGVSDYIAKPFTADLLTQKVKEVLSR